MAGSKSKDTIIRDAKKVISIEKQAIDDLQKRFTKPGFRDNFASAIDLLYKCKGKVVVMGIGKSGIIAQKIVATFNSTGTYSIFLHTADTIHGDLGAIREDDVVLIISKSGSTNDIKTLLPIFKSQKIKIVSIVGNMKSELARLSDYTIDASVNIEACPHNLAPTSSTTVTLVIGDAIAISLLQKKGFSENDFATLHPGGNLGAKLLLKVEDIMVKGDDIPRVKENAMLKEVIYEMSSKRLGCTAVVNGKSIKGFITDGDIRRYLEKNMNLENTKAKDVMTKNPKKARSNMLAKRALEFMEDNKITQLLVSDSDGKLAGIVHMHKLIETGL